MSFCRSIDECKNIYIFSNSGNISMKRNFLGVLFVLSIIIGFIGFILNMLCVFIFSKLHLNFKFFTLLKIYSISSGLLNLNDFVMYLACAIFFEKFYLTYHASIYVCYVYVLIAVTLYTFGGIFDILIVIERYNMLSTGFKYLKNWSPTEMAFYSLIISLILNLPIVLNRQPIKIPILNNSSQNVYFYNYANSALSTSKFGSLLINTSLAIRDVLTLLVELWFNALTLYHLKKILQHKKKIVQNNERRASTIYKSDGNSTKMVVIMCILSILVHLYTYVSHYYSRDYNLNSKLIGVLGFFISNFKYSINFFIFYFYNNLFRDNFCELFKRKNDIFVTLI